MFWLATLNPGRKKRRLGGRKRKRTLGGGAVRKRIARAGRRKRLTAWQRAVRKHGGVMQAVKAMRKRKRRSAGSRKSFRGRPRIKRNSNGRFVNMAKTRRRKSAGARRRRRRNPWFGQPRRHAAAARKGWSRRRRRHGAVRRRRRSKVHNYVPTRYHRKRRYAANPVVPVSWNPRRKRRHASRRRYRRNSVLPVRWNPGSAVSASPIKGILDRVKKFVDVQFWTQTAAPGVVGFTSTKMVGGFVYSGIVGFLPKLDPNVDKVVRIGTDVLAASGLGWAASRFLGKSIGDAVWIGGVLSIAHSVLKAVLGGTQIAKVIGLDGLGSDLEERMKAAVAQRVAQELNGLGTYMNTTDLQPSLNGVGEFITDVGLRRQAGYAPSPNGDLRDYDPSNSETRF